ncbi:MAG: 4Fe-4S dicluster domain-containing protein [Butyrivibrio sp.]|uniref:4Fe-4S binding protein n=1 Tax=Butyrivibrio sp. TaxID=28121 RepID=UPI001B7A82D0|nr:4Fe-4S binding protein [Butyrivibrio sp.]MBP3782839.1 4Fe-4S dicluster domain-containing protein [Butyrivibrio sp.]MBP3813871.1 4Fe-4S dicluster domain-containing protein [Butyrivibrio sp.]
MALINFNKTVLHNLVSKPKTRKAEKEYPVGTRGHVENDMDLCILCGLCSIKCPTHAITVDKNEKTWSIRPMSCIQCRCCVDNCPKKSLSMGLRFQEPGTEKLTKTFKQSEKAIAAQEALMKAAKERAAAAAAAKAAAANAAGAPAPATAAPEKAPAAPAQATQDQNKE